MIEKDVENDVYPVRDIRLILKACQADDPLRPGDPRLHDFSSLRGGDGVVELADTLEQEVSDNKYHHCIMCGHRGAGKSTELLKLKKWADDQGFFTVWNEVDVHFGLAELQFSDLYLLTAESVTRAMSGENMSVPNKDLKSIVEWFSEIVDERKNQTKLDHDIKAGGKAGLTLFFSKLFAEYSASVVAGSEYTSTVRSKFKQSPNDLMELTNKLLLDAGEILIKNGRHKGLLVLFDNLDRYPSETIKTLLFTGSTLVRKLACHAIFTMPVELRCSPDQTWWDDYDANVMIPMLAIRDQSEAWNDTIGETRFNENAVDEMSRALAKRIDIDKLFEKTEDAKLIVKLSGGCMRDLLHLVDTSRQKSRKSLKDTPKKLTSDGVRKAIEEYRLQQTEGLQECDYIRLVALARRDPNSDVIDDHAMRLMNRRRILRYRSESTSWIDIHPILLEDRRFQRDFANASRLVSE